MPSFSPIRISDIGLYLRCPRLVYFDGLEAIPQKQDAERILLKSLMLSPLIAVAAEASDIASTLQSILSALAEEMPLVYDLPAEEVQAARSSWKERWRL